MMSLLEKFERHAGLFGRMADTLGIDLGEAAGSGRLGGVALRSAVVGRMGCDRVDACGEWLDDHAEGAEATPEYCRNKAMLDRLARG